jgi:hypothetical protein
MEYKTPLVVRSVNIRKGVGGGAKDSVGLAVQKGLKFE